jgi:hypothetical protein
MRGGKKDRRRALDPGQMRGGGAEARGLALQQRLDEGDALGELFRVRLARPTFLVPLCPAPMPSTARPFDIWSSEAIAAALTAGWRVNRLVTQSATRVCREARATSVADTHGSMALPGVSAMPIIA